MNFSYLHGMTNDFTISQDLAQVLGSQHIPQGRLCQQASGAIGILHIGNRCGSIMDSEIHHSIYCHSHAVFC